MSQEEPTKKIEEEPIDPEVEAWIIKRAQQKQWHPDDIEFKYRLARMLHPERYKQYAEIMRENDVMGIGIPLPSLFHDLIKLPDVYQPSDGSRSIRNPTFEQKKEQALRSIKNYFNDWLSVKTTYDHIRWDVQDENTGKSVLEAMKILIDKFHPLFIEFVESVRRAIDENNLVYPPSISEELIEYASQMQILSNKYGELPAYKAYKSFPNFYFINNMPDDMTRADWFLQGKPRKTT